MTDWRICLDFGTALSKAAAAPNGDLPEARAGARPLAIGSAGGDDTAFLARCALFLTDAQAVFGRRAFLEAERAAHQRREALLSFKTILAAPDLEAALALKAPRAVDPEGRFTRRDLVVAYLAWLLELVSEAAARDEAIGPGGGASARLRYTRPGWRADAVGQSHRVVTRLFDEADAVRHLLGPALLAEEGVGLNALGVALERARIAVGPSRIDACVFEAVAAATCHLAPQTPSEALTAGASKGSRGDAQAWLVFDMGAGTSDLAAVTIGPDGVHEVNEARATLSAAGDHLDRILLNQILKHARKAKSPAQQSDLWRRTLLSVRERKEGLFIEGRASLRYEGQVIAVRRADVEGDADFKVFRKALEAAFKESLDAAALRAAEIGAASLGVALAGGGSSLPFVREMARAARTKRKVAVHVAPAVPAWATTGAFAGQLAPLFPQTSIALGGAIAPSSLLVSL